MFEHSLIHAPGSLRLDASVIAIGAFDGVHRGHQAVIGRAVEAAAERGCFSLVYTFDPPPKAAFADARILTSIEEKASRIAHLGPTHMVVATFDAQYAARSPQAFMDELTDFGPGLICVGADFRFGAGGRGDVALLASRFEIEIVEPVRCSRGEVISSTRIRALRTADPERARALLGWQANGRSLLGVVGSRGEMAFG